MESSLSQRIGFVFLKASLVKLICLRISFLHRPLEVTTEPRLLNLSTCSILMSPNFRVQVGGVSDLEMTMHLVSLWLILRPFDSPLLLISSRSCWRPSSVVAIKTMSSAFPTNEKSNFQIGRSGNNGSLTIKVELFKVTRSFACTYNCTRHKKKQQKITER